MWWGVTLQDIDGQVTCFGIPDLLQLSPVVTLRGYEQVSLIQVVYYVYIQLHLAGYLLKSCPVYTKDVKPVRLAFFDLLNLSHFSGNRLLFFYSDLTAIIKPANFGSRGLTPQDGVNGFVVPEQDSGSLASAIQKLLDDPELRAEMGTQGYDLTVQYDYERQVQGFRDAIEYALRN